MPYSFFSVIWIVLLLALGPASVLAQSAASTGRTILVLDASGSMWGQIDGEAKIVIARRVIDDLLDTVPAGQSLGLTAYGHREKGNCRDIETLVEPGPDTREAIRSAVNTLNPRGKTPLSDAVVAAAEALKFEEDAATVILVSDGRETCDRDPCAVGRRLAELGIDFTAHVIGFDVADADAQSQLQCLAETTGGRFLTAANAGELSDALEAVSAPPAPATIDVVFEATDGEGGPAITRDLVWALTNEDTGETLVEGFDIAALRMALEPGRYTAEVVRSSDEATAQRTVDVTDSETYSLALVVEQADASVSAVETAAAGATIPVQWTGPDEEKDYITVSAAGADDNDYVNYTYTNEGSPLKLVMPPEPGDYEIRYIQRQGRKMLASRPVTVEPVEASVSAPQTAAAGEPVAVEWTGPDYKGDYVTVSAAGAGDNDYINYTYTNEGSPLKLVMPPEPGDYEIRYIQRQGRKMLASRPVTVEAVAASVSAPQTAAAGETLAVEWSGPDYKGDYVTVSVAGAGDNDYINYTYTSEGSPLKLVMPPEPGDYEIRYIQRQGRKMLVSRPVTVEAVEASVSAPATAAAGETLAVEWTGPDYKSDYITVSAAGAGDNDYINYTYTSEGSPLKLVMPPDPGDYEIRYIQRQGRKMLASRPVTVEPVEANLSAPGTAAAGETLVVDWTGPDYKGDYITVSAADAEDNDYINYTYTNEGSPLKLEMPTEPGDYEIRYIQRQGRKMLVSRPVTVE